MAQFNSCNSKATSLGSGTFGAGMLQVLRTMVTSVVLITAFLVLAGIAIGLSGCSKSKTKESNINSQPTTPGPVASATPVTIPAETPVTKKKSSAIKRASVLTYSSNTYGVTFRFPSQYQLITPGSENEKSTLVEEVPKNFAQPGGVTVATVELPGDSATSFFSVSANKGVTADECTQFSIPSPADVASNGPVNEDDGSIPSKTSIHGVEFTKVENASEQEDVKYYHHYEPASDGVAGTCYEFALGVEQGRVSSKTMDDPGLFDRLERVMATVKIKPQEGTTTAATVPGREPSETSLQ